MEIILTGTNLDLSDRFKDIANEKAERLQKLASKANTFHVEVTEKKNPSEKDNAGKVEITVTGPNKTLHSEARAQEIYSALDLAIDKIEAQLRKLHDKETTIDRTKQVY